MYMDYENENDYLAAVNAVLAIINKEPPVRYCNGIFDYINIFNPNYVNGGSGWGFMGNIMLGCGFNTSGMCDHPELAVAAGMAVY